MSMLLMVKAMQCKVGNATRKLVLLKLADNASDGGVCFPSYQHIADQCEISRRSAISHIDALIEMGWVEKKERKTKEGNTSNLYILRLEQGGENTASSSENSSLGGVNNLHHPSENISPTPSENISPRTSHSINQSINHKKTMQKKSTALTLLAQFGITEQLAEDFITHRKAKKAPITKTALERLQKQADLAGLPLAEVAEIMIERGWRGFKAGWDWQETPQNRSKKSKFDDNDDSWWRGKTIEIRGF
ncbi:helix-turn-helix domain-containing protein [Gallibacterium anatis]|uniref:DNA-binding protein n=1 Tax=Gallibacterium anatis 12656/12 TaxID=1195244 RepID=U1H4T6_9PAST|nr:helix-turn-helix domain-containing protein [Gallibacterium anatis]ERF79471.1 DNA-binding protein [Gallibacterium anatis 12656/12]